MSSADSILFAYQERMIALEKLYSRLARGAEELAAGLQRSAETRHITHGTSKQPFTVQFFQNNPDFPMQFSVVASTGMLAVSYDDPTGYIGALLHYYNSEEIADSQRFYTYQLQDSALKLWRIDAFESTECEESDIIQSLFEEMLIPKLRPRQIATGTLRELDRTRELMQTDG